MNLLDIIFAIILLGFFVFSFMKGIVREIFSLMGVVGGFFAASWWDTALAMKMAPVIPEQGAAEMLSFVLIIVAGYFVGLVLGGLADLLGGNVGGIFSGLFGALVGLLKGWTICMAIYWVIYKHLPVFQDEIRESVIGRVLGHSLAALMRNDLL